MTPFFKAIPTAFLLALAAAIAGAQQSQVLPQGDLGGYLTPWLDLEHPGFATDLDFADLPGLHPIEVNGPSGGASDCGAAAAQHLIGQNIAAIALPADVRVIGPDTVVTFDYREDRLNITHDTGGTITRAHCG